jgi:hypothetical protein
MDGPPNTSECKEIVMNGKQSKTFRDYCADKAETAKDEPTRKRFKRMEVAWLALADQQDWLDGEQPPLGYNRAVSPAVSSPSGHENRT